jgi:hypothetical protein
MFETSNLLVFATILLFISLLPNSVLSTPIGNIASREPLGTPLEKWAADYWQWWANIPLSEILKLKSGGTECLIGSDPTGQMTYLTNTYDLRNLKFKCSLSSTDYVLVPLLVGECDDTLTDVTLVTLTDYWTCGKNTDTTFKSASVWLDGKRIFERVDGKETDSTNAILVRNSPQFELLISSDKNHLEIDAGSHTAVVDGWYLVLNPLPPGEHTISYDILHWNCLTPLECAKPNVEAKEGNAQYTLKVQ